MPPRRPARKSWSAVEKDDCQGHGDNAAVRLRAQPPHRRPDIGDQRGTDEEQPRRGHADGPADPITGQLDQHLATALPPGVTLAVTRLDGGTATVDLTGTERTPSGLQSRLAVGQIVLTVSSLPGIDSVLLSHDGKPVEAPLLSGELTSDPLRAAEYSGLLVAPPT